MRSRQSGFTMIELIMVIVILGILAAVAMPRFIDLRSNATKASVDGMAGSLASAMAINYAGCAVVNQSTADATKCKQINTCDDAFDLVQNGTALKADAQWDITTTSLSSGAGVNGTEASCTVAYLPGGTANAGGTPTGQEIATFTGIGAGN